jgi:DNA polymerase (family 10)
MVTSGSLMDKASRSLAKSKRLILNEYGLWRGNERIAGADEKEIFKALGLEYVPPEQRI